MDIFFDDRFYLFQKYFIRWESTVFGMLHGKANEMLQYVVDKASHHRGAEACILLLTKSQNVGTIIVKGTFDVRLESSRGEAKLLRARNGKMLLIDLTFCIRYGGAGIACQVGKIRGKSLL